MQVLIFARWNLSITATEPSPRICGYVLRPLCEMEKAWSWWPHTISLWKVALPVWRALRFTLKLLCFFIALYFSHAFVKQSAQSNQSINGSYLGIFKVLIASFKQKLFSKFTKKTSLDWNHSSEERLFFYCCSFFISRQDLSVWPWLF